MQDGEQAGLLRGKCEEFSRAAVEADPTLRLVRGWYVDPHWGRQEHWWTVRPDGIIHDPTSRQFPMGGVTEWYEEFVGVYPCQECGVEVPEKISSLNLESLLDRYIEVQKKTKDEFSNVYVKRAVKAPSDDDSTVPF